MNLKNLIVTKKDMENIIRNRFYILISKLFIYCSFCLFFSCQTDTKTDSTIDKINISVQDSTNKLILATEKIVIDITNTPELKFDNPNHNLGSIVQGNKDKFNYNFTNSGKNPLIIYGVKPSCNCTNVDYTKEPVLPKQKGYISVTFDSSDKHIGLNRIVIVIITNSYKKYYKVSFTVNVLSKNK